MNPVPNPPFHEGQGIAAILTAWILAQTLKVVGGVFREKKINFRWLLQSGGMPSSHSAAVASLSTVVGLYYGFGTMPFWISLVFSVIIMFDAAGVRRAVGRQAGILNEIVDEIQKGKVQEERLKELLGHTPIEVFAGAALGITVALLICLSD
ncbi:MAG TPA: divergent PAP2 family protein [Candidatus Omnitrophota bacterium]|nr:divergent PAP2 family protein [Candidatus Omnitrophota bacterium]